MPKHLQHLWFHQQQFLLDWQKCTYLVQWAMMPQIQQNILLSIAKDSFCFAICTSKIFYCEQTYGWFSTLFCKHCQRQHAYNFTTSVTFFVSCLLTKLHHSSQDKYYILLQNMSNTLSKIAPKIMQLLMYLVTVMFCLLTKKGQSFCLVLLFCNVCVVLLN